MANRLSHSQINKFLFCGEAWKKHYIDGLRAVELSSALPFGGAFGKACEFILNPSATELTLTLTGKLTANDVFDYHWKYSDINGELTNIQEYQYMAYSKYDIDNDLITLQESEDAPEWYSLRAKAHLMLDTFQKELLPLIEHVYSTEEKIELSNDEGDSSIGFADAVVKLKGYDKPVILDFKTAAREYEQDSVRTSVQLSQYLHVLSDKYDTRLAGYAVFLKQIEKNRVKICTKCGNNGTGGRHKTCDKVVENTRCSGEWKETIKPKAKMQLIIDEIPLATEEFIIGNIENINASIKTGVYTKNVNGCFDNGWGRPCEFQKKCWTGSDEGLIKVEKK